jgi:transcriptional regulator with XRE-family HTH domain
LGKIILKARQARLAYQHRIGRPVSIQEVATKIGVTRAYLSNIERGKAWPNAQVLAKLCALYGVGVGDILEFTSEDKHVPGLAPASRLAPAPGYRM